MTTSVTRGLVTAATALSGVVTGTTIDTGIVKLSAWRRLGAEPWADSSGMVAILAIGHLLTTARAVPHMVRVRETGDPASLQEALGSFTRWHLARTGIDALTFAANLWSLRSVSRS